MFFKYTSKYIIFRFDLLILKFHIILFYLFSLYIKVLKIIFQISYRTIYIFNLYIILFINLRLTLFLRKDIRKSFLDIDNTATKILNLLTKFFLKHILKFKKFFKFSSFYF